VLLVIAPSCQTLRVNPASTAAIETPESQPTTSTELPPVEAEPETPAPNLTEQIPTEIIHTPTTEATEHLDLHPRYTISATLDYAWHYLAVSQEVIFSNPSKDVLDELILVVQTNWRPNAFQLTSISTKQGPAIRSYSLDGIRLRVLFNEHLEPGETLELSMVYEINIPPLLTSEDFGPNPFGYTTRQTNLTDWYPFVPPYVGGEGWLVHNPWYYGEHLVYPYADFEVSIRLVNAPQTTVIAASALDVGTAELHRYILPGARNFVWSVSPEYRVTQEIVGSTTILGYAFPYDAVPGAAAFRTTVEALTLYNQIFGPYPHESMTVVQADFDHGMEYSGLYFLSRAFYNIYDGTPSTFLVSIAAHETAHQWWYGLVGNDQAMEPWLDEALCTFSERLFYENLHPASLDWWEFVRVAYYEPTGWVNSTIYNTPGYRPYRDAVYLNGALFLEELRALVGEEVFLSFLQDYVTRSTGKLVSGNDFFNILGKHSDVDLSILLDRYFQTR
jgi:hypothetical protein